MRRWPAGTRAASASMARCDSVPGIVIPDNGGVRPFRLLGMVHNGMPALVDPGHWECNEMGHTSWVFGGQLARRRATRCELDGRIDGLLRELWQSTRRWGGLLRKLWTIRPRARRLRSGWTGDLGRGSGVWVGHERCLGYGSGSGSGSASRIETRYRDRRRRACGRHGRRGACLLRHVQRRRVTIRRQVVAPKRQGSSGGGLYDTWTWTGSFVQRLLTLTVAITRDHDGTTLTTTALASIARSTGIGNEHGGLW